MMPSNGQSVEIEGCKCSNCIDHDSRHECIMGRCSCCDLEDMLAVITKRDPDVEIIYEKGFVGNTSVA
jgi:hypothetical protein